MALHIGKFIPPPYAGIEAHIDQLLRTLHPQWPVTLLAARSPQRTSTDELSPYPTYTVRNWGRLASVTLSPGVIRKAAELWRKHQIGIMHVHAPNPWGDWLTLSAPRNLPVVMSWHSDIVRQRTLMVLYRHWQRAAVLRADRIVVATPMHYEGSRQLRLPGIEKKLVIVPYGIDFSDFDRPTPIPEITQDLRAWAAGRPLALTVGRHVYYKGYDYLLRALARTREPLVLAFVGIGPLTSQLRRMAEELGVANRVRWLGQLARAGVISAMQACDFFTLPSVQPSEAFGLASAEAMACGKPTVVCRLGTGVDYLNQDGKTSLVVTPADVGALADALDQLARDSALRQQLGKQASTWVRKVCNLQEMREATLAMYRSLL